MVTWSPGYFFHTESVGSQPVPNTETLSHPQPSDEENLAALYMKTEEYVALGGLITIIASALALVIKQVESSRCGDIDCCGVKCKRNVEQQPEQEQPQQERQQ